jgi:hypothetical protein
MVNLKKEKYMIQVKVFVKINNEMFKVCRLFKALQDFGIQNIFLP